MTEVEFVTAELTTLGFEPDGELPNGSQRLKLRGRNLYATVGPRSVLVYSKLPTGRPSTFAKFLIYQRPQMKNYLAKVIDTPDSQ